MKKGFTIKDHNGQYLKASFGVPTKFVTPYWGIAVKFATEAEAKKEIEGREMFYKVVPFNTVSGLVHFG